MYDRQAPLLESNKRKEKRRKKCCICSLKRPPEERRLAIVFFFSGFPEKACAYILIIVMYVDVCTLPLLVASCAYWLMTRCVVSTIIRSIIYIQAKLLVVTTILLSMGNSYYTSALAHY